MVRLTIAHVAKLAGVSRDTVKRCERLGLVASVRDRNNWRLFSHDAVQKLRDIYCHDPAESGQGGGHDGAPPGDR